MKNMQKVISSLFVLSMVFVFLSSNANGKGNSHQFDLPFKKTLVNAKSGRFIVEPNIFKVRVWSPVNRTVGFVIQKVTVTDTTGASLSFAVSGAAQLANVAFVSIPITEDKSSRLIQLLKTKGTEVDVKLRIETFTYIVK